MEVRTFNPIPILKVSKFLRCVTKRRKCFLRNEVMGCPGGDNSGSSLEVFRRKGLTICQGRRVFLSRREG